MLVSAATDCLVESEFLLAEEAILHQDEADQRALPEPCLQEDIGDDDAASPCTHTSGKQLRHRWVTLQSIAELSATEKPSLLQRLLGRR